MRRRVREGAAPDAAPAHLLRYDPADWPAPACHPECAFWDAVEQWRLENPIDLGDTTGAGLPLVLDGPDVPFHPVAAGRVLVDGAHDDRVI